MEQKPTLTQKAISYLNLLLRIVIIVLVVILLHSIYKGLQQDGYIIQPIQTPKSFTDSGFSGVVVANKLQDKVNQIKENTNSGRQDSLRISANSTSDLKMDVMGIGVSSTSLIYHLRDLLRIESKTIRGDLTDLDNELALTIRVHNFPVKVISESYDDDNSSRAFEQLITRVAEHILSCTDPYYQAINLYDNNKYDEAHELIREMITNRPGEAKWGYLAWSNMMAKQGEEEKAKEYLLKSLELDENFFIPNVNIGWRYRNEEQYEKAIAHFEKALISKPDHFGAINGMAICHQELGEQEESEKYLKMNIERNPDVIWGYMAYADFYTLVKQDTQKAIAIFNTAKSNVTQDDDYYLTQAGYYFFQSKMDSALIYLNKSLDFNANNVIALREVIQYLTSPEIDKHGEAIIFLKRLAAIQEKGGADNDNLIDTYNRLAMAEWRVSEFDSAFVHVQKAIDMAPNYPIPYTTLAEIYYAKNNKNRFYQIMQKAFDMGLQFNENWFEEEPYKSLKSEPRFDQMLKKYNAKIKQDLKG